MEVLTSIRLTPGFIRGDRRNPTPRLLHKPLDASASSQKGERNSNFKLSDIYFTTEDTEDTEIYTVYRLRSLRSLRSLR